MIDVSPKNNVKNCHVLYTLGRNLANKAIFGPAN